MKKAVLFCILLLLGLYGVRYWFEQNPDLDSELVLTIQDGAQTLQERLRSPEFRDKVLQKLKDTQLEIQDEAAEQWIVLKQLAEDGLIRLKEKDSDSLRQVADAVTRAAQSEGERIRIEEALLSPPPANWMVAAVANLILLAWVTLGILLLWGIARFFGRYRQRED